MREVDVESPQPFQSAKAVADRLSDLHTWMLLSEHHLTGE